MKMPTLQRSRAAEAPPGLIRKARVDRRTDALLTRLAPGDIAVLDHSDLDRSTAQRLIDAEVGAVVNAGPLFSGRFASLGPELLAAAGVPLVDSAGAAALAVKDGATVRLHEADLFVEDDRVATGRIVTADEVASDMELARTGLATQLESFTHNSAAFLRREEGLLLHGRGYPRLTTTVAGRPVAVVADGHECAAQLRSIKSWLAEQRPILIGVDRGADRLAERGLRPDIVVLSGQVGDDRLPSVKVLRAAADVVVRSDSTQTDLERFERMGLRPLRLVTGATTEDVALLLAHAGEPTLVVAAGLPGALEEFLDRQHTGLASGYLTRLRLGSSLVDARAVAALYSGRVRGWHLFAALLAGLLALAVAIGVTPLGQEWAADSGDWIAARFHDLLDFGQGLL